MLVKGKNLHQTKHQVWGWLFVFWDEMTPLADFQLNVSSQNGCWAHAKPVQRQLNQPKGIATFTLMCQKASVFLHFAMSVCHLQTKPQLFQKFFQ